MPYLLNREQYSRIYGCTARSVSNYERAGAPLDEPEEMHRWLWRRRTQPAGFCSKSVDEIATAYARARATGAEVDTFLREEIRELIISADVDQLRVRCKLMAAAKEGFEPAYAPAVTAGLNAILAGVRKVFAALGLEPDETHSTLLDVDEDDSGEDEEEPEEEG